MTTYTDEDDIFESLKHMPSTKALWESLERISSWDDFGGFAGRTHTEETKRKMSVAHLGKKYNMTPEGRAKLSQQAKGRPQTPGRAAALAKHNAKPRSKESNEKRSVALKGKPLPRVACPYCGTSGSAGNIARWHNTNCKSYTQQDPHNHQGC